MNVLAITAHPDDMEFKCAGTLIKCVKRGDNVFLCTINNGSMGHEVIMPDELAKIRTEEARKACELAGITYLPANIGDLQSYYQSREQKDIVVDIIRQANPDLILTLDPEDYMCDHVAAAKLAFDCAFMATVPHYITEHPACDKICPIYYMETSGGFGFIPTEYVDITEEFDLKMEMLHCHQSQEVWLRDHDHCDYTESMKIISQFRGMQCKAKYAEGFRQCLVDHRMTTTRLLP